MLCFCCTVWVVGCRYSRTHLTKNIDIGMLHLIEPHCFYTNPSQVQASTIPVCCGNATAFSRQNLIEYSDRYCGRRSLQSLPSRLHPHPARSSARGVLLGSCHPPQRAATASLFLARLRRTLRRTRAGDVDGTPYLPQVTRPAANTHHAHAEG